MLQALTGIAAFLGAAGVYFAAAAAHSRPGTGLDTASHMLLFHACAGIAACAAIRTGLIGRPLALVAVILLLAGAALFAGDLVLRAYAGHRLFPFAAPTGGTLTIGGWLLLALAAFLSLR
jgi:uncharacterized membrane protein YgdD (TMEM256/DUF423 family)